MKTKQIILFLMLLTFNFSAYAQNNNSINIPALRNNNYCTQLYSENEPFLMLAGELGNSSASSLEYMSPIWSKLTEMNLNTVLVPVYWELIEPLEGQYEFALVDSLIFSARENNLKLVLLWFGSWKNSMSCYVPL